MKERILIISEDSCVKQLLTDTLQADAVHIYCATSVNDALSHFIPENVTLVIIDLHLSEMSGIELLKLIYEQQPIPLIAISSNSSIQEEIQALEYGADRYLAKPLIKERFLAHKKSLMRRYWLNWKEYTSIPKVLSFENGLKVNFQTRTAYWRGTRIELRPKPFLLLARLTESNGDVVTKEQLYNDVWGCEYDKELDVALKYHISNLRSELNRHGISELVQTIWGVGYRLCPERYVD